MRNHFHELVICGHMDYGITAALIHIKTRYKLIKVIPPDDDLAESKHVEFVLHFYLINTCRVQLKCDGTR
jgi:hypothetical protein